MKKLLLLLFVVIFFTGCTSIDTNLTDEIKTSDITKQIELPFPEGRGLIKIEANHHLTKSDNFKQINNINLNKNDDIFIDTKNCVLYVCNNYRIKYIFLYYSNQNLEIRKSNKGNYSYITLKKYRILNKKSMQAFIKYSVLGTSEFIFDENEALINNY